MCTSYISKNKRVSLLIHISSFSNGTTSVHAYPISPVRTQALDSFGASLMVGEVESTCSGCETN
jgi:hypothetical protein